MKAPGMSISHSTKAPKEQVDLLVTFFFFFFCPIFQVPAIRSLQFYVCYYGWGYFRKNSNNGCRGSDVYQAFYFIVAIIPYWSRLIQVFDSDTYMTVLFLVSSMMCT